MDVRVMQHIGSVRTKKAPPNLIADNANGASPDMSGPTRTACNDYSHQSKQLLTVLMNSVYLLESQLTPCGSIAAAEADALGASRFAPKVLEPRPVEPTRRQLP